MKTFPSSIDTEIAAEQSAWVELYDIYLKNAIVTPWGTTNVIRLCSRLGNNFQFFAPTAAPEPDGTQGDAATYYPWPLKRQPVRANSQFADSRVEITGSNVTGEWATMLQNVDWYDVPVLIRKVKLGMTNATNTDCAAVFSGLVDSARISDKQITLICSNDLALLNRVLPSENMHASCRFRWADNQCTAIRFKAENYKAKTVGSGSTTTVVKSSGLTEDAGNAASYGTDLVDALSNGAITASSEQTSGGIFWVGDAIAGYFWCPPFFGIAVGNEISFSPGPAPAGMTNPTYFVVYSGNGQIALSATSGGPIIPVTELGIRLLTMVSAHNAYRVKSSYPAQHWQFTTDADWGTVDNAYYVIPDAQAGLKNPALKPYIQFDFGSAKTPRLWRVSSAPSVQDEQRLRIIQFFSSTDATNWTFESYFEMPNRGGELFDVLIPKASTARYWRICVRSRWGESLYKIMFAEVQAYENGRHWWRDGKITFDAATTTAALRGVSRRILASYNGEVEVEQLPAAPVSGDTFVIERGCARNFNACCERQNTENYGGFNDLPIQTVIR